MNTEKIWSVWMILSVWKTTAVVHYGYDYNGLANVGHWNNGHALVNFLTKLGSLGRKPRFGIGNDIFLMDMCTHF